jgi:hypothetical protein
MGLSIALTGVVLSLFGYGLGRFALSPPQQSELAAACGAMMVIGVWAIPIGLIIQIWQ